MHQKLVFLLALCAFFQACTTSSLLQKSAAALLDSETTTTAKFSYTEELHELGHLSEPWETNTYKGRGDFWVQDATFMRQDTLTSDRGRTYNSKTDYRNEVLLYLDYGDETLLLMTKAMSFEKLIQTARYSPTIVVQLFLKNEKTLQLQKTATQHIYSQEIGGFSTKLFLNKRNGLVDKISYLSYDELYGDVETVFFYSAYATKGDLTYPSAVRIEKINGKVVDRVEVLNAECPTTLSALLEQPDGYENKAEEAEQLDVSVSKYKEYIHFVDLTHSEDRCMIVEFEDFLLVAEAPLNAKNGELLIAEAKKIAPHKPIKYFVFGHHHPHYLGGLRAFVHEGATVLCTELSKDYVAYIANAPHSLEPDKLHVEPKPLKTQLIKDSLVLGEQQQMVLYSIGEQSAHTKDYLLYYFPKEKLLFQDDLCWIPKEGAITKAGARQIGLYKSIQALNISVDTIIQSWPVNSHRVKTVIPFSDLESSIRVEK